MLKRAELLKMTFKLITLAVIVQDVIFLEGCSLSGKPRVRLGSYATSTPGTNFIDISSLGRRSYNSFLFENNGIVYTCRGGHIDIAHVRIGADNVRYLYYKIRRNLINTRPEFRFKLNVEPSTYFVKLRYPPGWEDLTQAQKRKTADEIAMELSQYFTFTMTTWHEVLTWFGYNCMGFLPEQPSAFSWEDIYSNLVGIRIGTQALRDEEHGYNSAVTIAIKKELEDLGVQPRHTAWRAAEKMRGKWFDGFLLVDMRERNFDIGLDDGFVTPILVPGVREDAEPQSYPVPKLDEFYERGFAMVLEVEPREFERDKILKIIYPNGGSRMTLPAKHIPVIIDYIRNTHLNGSANMQPGDKL